MGDNNISAIKFGRKYYYQHADLIAAYPYIFRGCKTTKDFVKKYNIGGNNFTFGKETDDGWIETNGTSRKYDKMFISRKWFDNKFDEEDLVDPDVAADAPDIIELEDDEKFFDNDNNIVEIEVRGEREFDKCYFKVKDIADGFGLESLHNILTKKDKQGYELGKHYVYFCTGGTKRKTRKLFLTYTGVMRVIFASNKKNTEKFVAWASKIIFTHQLGKADDKIKLAGKMLDISPKTIKALLKKSSKVISSIYLFSIGQAKHLRSKLKIPKTFKDTDMIYRFGTTSDLARRIGEHEDTFGKIANCKIQLEIFEFIDPEYIFKAETRIAHLFEGMEMKVFPKKELVIIPKPKLKLIKEHFATIANSYAGNIAEIKNTFKELLREKEREIAAKDIEIIKVNHANELMAEKHQKEIAQKERELMAKENQILQMKLKESERKRVRAK